LFGGFNSLFVEFTSLFDRFNSLFGRLGNSALGANGIKALAAPAYAQKAAQPMFSQFLPVHQGT
jgi:hypothetical protein